MTAHAHAVRGGRRQLLGFRRGASWMVVYSSVLCPGLISILCVCSPSDSFESRVLRRRVTLLASRNSYKKIDTHRQEFDGGLCKKDTLTILATAALPLILFRVVTHARKDDAPRQVQVLARPPVERDWSTHSLSVLPLLLMSSFLAISTFSSTSDGCVHPTMTL